jgi:hypothetical protein
VKHSNNNSSKNQGQNTFTSRQRLSAVLNHQPVDRVCVDFGAGGQTGIGVCAVDRLRKAVLGDKDYCVKVTEPYQMLGEVDEQLHQVLGLDVVGIDPPSTMFGFPNQDWKPVLTRPAQCLVFLIKTGSLLLCLMELKYSYLRSLTYKMIKMVIF